MLEIKDLSVRFRNNFEILRGIQLKLYPGEVTTIVGLSGCGKTTFISAINGVLSYHNQSQVDGEIHLNQVPIIDKSLLDISKHIGTVYQDPDTQIIFSSVYAELAFALENMCVPTEQIHQTIDQVTSELDICHLLDRNPNELSGGEKQLIVLASILVMGVDVLLLDEIMAQVDEKGCLLIKQAIRKLKQEGKIILMIEHELDHLDISDHVFQLKEGDLIEFNGELL